ncbi:MAG: PIG-L family deacetylase [Candidatus Latescibacteria bacterium]|jgi:N-acetylglucosamine malate deacetylase 2|nr:PIG-L family deacetylase [Candidatus Latescibacterota bacterium]
MKILYIYPHPDDESFGPAHAMSKQRRQKHEVYLLTLTKGGATKQRFKYGYSIEEMGEVRYQEMQNVAKVLDLSGMKVLDLPDSGLKEMDPREIEKVIIKEIINIQPTVLVTYPVHGISGFPDHLVTHAVVKNAYLQLKENVTYLKRLAFHTITEDESKQADYFHLNGSKPEEIDCVVKVDKIDIENSLKALDCYITFQETIEKTGIKQFINNQVMFEIFQENHNPPLSDLFEMLN